MIRHLTPRDYTTMPWANGLGQTVEMLRMEEAGALQWRLSMAAVVADGAFSLFPGIERNLTVLEGPGFALKGAGIALDCRPLLPVAFPGDVAVEAFGVRAPSQDFNVMTARHRRLPRVRVHGGAGEAAPEGGTLCLLALGPCRAGGRAMGRHDLLVAQERLEIDGPMIVVVL